MLESFSDVVLKGDRVFLRPMSEKDTKYIVKWRNDPEINKWFFSSEPITVQSHLKWFKTSRKNRLDFMICLNKSALPIGTVNFKNIDLGQKKAEAGKLLGDLSQWGKGLASEAFRLWLEFGFDRVGLNYIYVKTLANNERNINLNKKIGFRTKEILKNGYKRGSEAFDVVVMSLEKQDAHKMGLCRSLDRSV